MVIDVSTVTAALEEALVPIAAVGLAVLVAMVGVKVFQLLRAAVGEGEFSGGGSGDPLSGGGTPDDNDMLGHSDEDWNESRKWM